MNFSDPPKTLQAKFPETSCEYSRIEDDTMRREWMSIYFLEPESGGSVSTSTATVENKKRKRLREVWLNHEDVDKKYGKDAEIAKKGMLSRPFKHNKALRDAGKLEYQDWIEIGDTDLSKTDRTDVTTIADLRQRWGHNISWNRKTLNVYACTS